MTTTRIYIGPPGCGKTTKIGALVTEAVEAGRVPLVTSLTRTAAAEVVGRSLPISQDHVGTLHGHAYRALDRPALVYPHLQDWNASEPLYAFSEYGGTDADDPYTDRRGGTHGDDMLQGYDLLRAACQTERASWAPGVEAFAKRWSAWKQSNGYLDFTDVIEQATKEIPTAPGQPDVLLADEAQDLSRLELDLLRKWAQRASELVIVGDPQQALYTWRGAAPEMFSKVDPEFRHTLSRSYRVPRAVHRVATRWITELSDKTPVEYHPRDEDGEAGIFNTNYRYPEPLVTSATEFVRDGLSVMICASCSYFLNPTLAVLRKNGIPFANPWRFKRGDWNPLRTGRGVSMPQRILAFLSPLLRSDSDDDFNFGANAPRSWSMTELGRWVGAIKAKGVLNRGAKAEILALAKGESSISQTCVARERLDGWFTEDVRPLIARVIGGEIATDEALRWFENHLATEKQRPSAFPLLVVRKNGFDALRKRPTLYIGTIHSFKGAEADVVFVYPDLSRRGMCEWMTCKQVGQQGSARDSVIRMFYVALTRARQRLCVCMPASAWNAPVWCNLN